MSGKIEISHYSILIIALIACFTDLIWRRIFNWLTLPAAVFGILTSIYYLGWAGAQEAVLGFGSGLLLYGWMFAFGFIGGGDVKLLMALGAWGGLHYTLSVAILAVLLGGLFSVVTLIVKGKMLKFIKKMVTFILSLSIQELEVQFPKLDTSLTMPFGIPISIAAVAVASGCSFTDQIFRWIGF